MAQYRKKPVVIEAVQWTGDMSVVIAFVGHDLPTYGPPHDGALRIATLEGDHACLLNDWIIRGVNGELYPCKPDIFEKTYEAVDSEGSPMHSVNSLLSDIRSVTEEPASKVHAPIVGRRGEEYR